MRKVNAMEQEPKTGLLHNRKIINLGITLGVVSLIFFSAFIVKGQSFSKGNFNTAYFKINPTFSSNSFGNYSAVWETKDGARSSSDIRLQSFYPDGLPKSDEIILSTEKDLVAKNPSVAMNDAGEIVAAWPSHVMNQLSGVVFNHNATQKTDFSVPLKTEIKSIQTTVAIDNTGNIILAWCDQLNNSINYQLFQKTGKPTGTALEIKTNNTNALISSPKITMNSANGEIVLLWQENDPQTNGWDIYMQRMHKDGSVIGDVIQVNSTYHQNPVAPDVIMNKKGETMVLWQMKDFIDDNRSSGTLLCKIYDNESNPVKDEFLINTSQVKAGAHPLLASNNSGNFVLIWKSLDDQLYNEETEIIPDFTAMATNTQMIKDILMDSTSINKKEKKCVLYIKGDTVQTLPLLMKSFRVNSEGTGVKVEWTTEMERDDFDFIVERSVNGSQFVPITTIPNKKTTALNHYSFVDATPLKKGFYRLKQVSQNGESAYLGTISAGWETESSGAMATAENEMMILKDQTGKEIESNIIIKK